MILLLLLLYGVPVYLIFFKYKWVPLTTFWKVFLWVPPLVALVFLWFALGRYTPTAHDAYVQAPVIQVAPRVGGTVAGLAVKDNQEVKQGTPLFQIDQRSYQIRVDQAKRQTDRGPGECGLALGGRVCSRRGGRPSRCQSAYGEAEHHGRPQGFGGRTRKPPAKSPSNSNWLRPQ